jgi:hypothetical protein
MKMSEEELCERICQLEKELKEEKEKNKGLNAILTLVNIGLENYISKDKIRDLIVERKFELQQEYEDFENDIKLKILEELLGD